MTIQLPSPVPVAPPPSPAWAEPVHEPAATTEAALEVGLERTRGNFMSRLRGFLGTGTGEGPSWDEVEETLIAGDVGAALAIDLVERARKRHDPGGAEAAIRAELAALLVPRDLDWSPRSAVRRRSGGRARRRRQRDRQDDDDRQARQPLRGRGAVGHPRRRRHLPRGGDRPAPDLGRSGRGADDRPCPGRRSGRGGLRRARCRGRARRGPRHRGHRGPAPYPLQPDGRAGQDPADRRQAAAGRGAGDDLRARRHDRPERPGPGEGVPRGRRADRDRPDQARFDGQGRHRLRDRGRARASRSASSGWGRRSATSSRSTPTRSWRRSSPRRCAWRLRAGRLVHLARDGDREPVHRGRRPAADRGRQDDEMADRREPQDGGTQQAAERRQP